MTETVTAIINMSVIMNAIILIAFLKLFVNGIITVAAVKHTFEEGLHQQRADALCKHHVVTFLYKNGRDAERD